MNEMRLPLERARDLVKQADGLIVTAGAGMGVDSGLADFRSAQGFWKAYPQLKKANISFSRIATPLAFEKDPLLAWGFYGHRLNMYHEKKPHDGFFKLLEICERIPRGYFVYTSNVDGHFQKSGFSERKIVECHGSLLRLQCTTPGCNYCWTNEKFKPQIDAINLKITSPPPLCPNCGNLARPNVMMFGDGNWVSHITKNQLLDFYLWRKKLLRPVVIEIGAGTAIPIVRIFGEQQECPLIRINVHDHYIKRPDDVGLSMTGRQALKLLSISLKSK